MLAPTRMKSLAGAEWAIVKRRASIGNHSLPKCLMLNNLNLVAFPVVKEALTAIEGKVRKVFCNKGRNMLLGRDCLEGANIDLYCPVALF